ncbi:regulator of chromosome condensation [Nematocida sp. ERTm5]|nr:regulator of chromosome condensation [Nematocida sp. ERTm5]
MENKKFMTRVYTWGAGDAGQLGADTEEGMSTKPVELVYFSNKRITEVVCGGMHSLALSIDGSLYSWGCNDEGVLGRSGDEEKPDRITFPEDVKIKKAVAGDSISAAVDENDNLWTWGLFRGPGGVIGHSLNKDGSVCKMAKSPVKISGIKVASVQAGCNHLAVVDNKGKLYTWGDGENGKLGRLISRRSKSTDCLSPKVAMASASAAVTGAYHSFAIKRINGKGEKSNSLAKQCLYTEGKFFKDTNGNEMYLYDQKREDLTADQMEEGRKRKVPSSSKYKYIRITPETQVPKDILYPPKGMTVYCTSKGELTLDPNQGKKIVLPTTRMRVLETDVPAPVSNSSSDEVAPITKSIREIEDEEEKGKITEEDLCLYAEYYKLEPGKEKKVTIVCDGIEKEVVLTGNSRKVEKPAKKPRSAAAAEMIRKAKEASMKAKKEESMGSDTEKKLEEKEKAKNHADSDEETQESEETDASTSVDSEEKMETENALKSKPEDNNGSKTVSNTEERSKPNNIANALPHSTTDTGQKVASDPKDSAEPSKGTPEGSNKVVDPGADAINVDSKQASADASTPIQRVRKRKIGSAKEEIKRKKQKKKRKTLVKKVPRDKLIVPGHGGNFILFNEVQRMFLFDRRRKDISTAENSKKVKFSASGVNNYGQAPNANEKGTWGPWMDYSKDDTGPSTFVKGMGGEHSTHILDANGTLWGLGRNTFGQLGVGDNENRTEFTKCAISNVDDFAITASHGMAMSQGKAYTWGFGEEGQLGYEADKEVSPKEVDFGNEIVISVGAGGQHSAIVTAVDVTENTELSNQDVIFGVNCSAST